MKQFKNILLILTLVMLPLMITVAQSPPHPGGDPASSGGVKVGGSQNTGAPIGNGSGVLILLAVAYALKRNSDSEKTD